MAYIVIATTDDVQTSSAQTLINANNYTNTAIPEQIQEVLLPLLPARPDQVSNVTWDFKTTTVDADGNEVKNGNIRQQLNMSTNQPIYLWIYAKL